MDSLKIASRWFERRVVGPGLTLLWEPHVHPLLRCNIWHLRGRDRDLLVDTGLGAASLREEIADLLDKPLVAVATHIHYDHVGSLHEFETRLMHRAEAPRMADYREFCALATHQLSAELLDYLSTLEMPVEHDALIDARPAPTSTSKASGSNPRLPPAKSKRETSSTWATATSRFCICRGTRSGASASGRPRPAHSSPGTRSTTARCSTTCPTVTSRTT